MTGLEPATSRTPYVNATNCATSRTNFDLRVQRYTFFFKQPNFFIMTNDKCFIISHLSLVISHLSLIIKEWSLLHKLVYLMSNSF